MNKSLYRTALEADHQTSKEVLIKEMVIEQNPPIDEEKQEQKAPTAAAIASPPDIPVLILLQQPSPGQQVAIVRDWGTAWGIFLSRQSEFCRVGVSKEGMNYHRQSMFLSWTSGAFEQ